MLRRLILPLMGSVVLGLPAAASAAAGACPNEALRAELASGALPDCRAYELVTPGFTNSQGLAAIIAVSSDGSRMLHDLVEGFAGAQGNSGVAEDEYLWTRTGSGWQGLGINPPASLFPAQEFAGFSADLSRTLWRVRGPSQPLNSQYLYAREADGSLVQIGPMSLETGPGPGDPWVSFAAKDKVVALSNDASHVLFSIHPKIEETPPFWPGDTTQKPGSERWSSLYELVGTGNSRPELVGVDGEGHLLGDCGVEAGSRNQNDTYNAISGSGETVFFTVLPHHGECTESPAPPVTELYARVGQFPIDTVAISEPTYIDCTRCQTGVTGFGHPAVPLAEAEFQGASEDGSKAFFLTEQELFAGDTGMNLYEYDFDNPAGQKIVRVSTGSGEPNVLGVARVSEDGSHVYFVAGGVLSGANAEGAAPTPGGDNLYVFERDAEHPGGSLAFIGTLAEPEQDGRDWIAEDHRPVQATPDGRFLVFQSVADLTPGDVSSQLQVFEYDARSERLVRVSAGAAGYGPGTTSADEHGASIGRLSFATQRGPTSGASNLAVSEDGTTVLFTSPGALAPGAVQAAANGVTSVYEYRSSGTIANGDVYLISGGNETLGAEAINLSASGQDAFFQTNSPLVAANPQQLRELYDARIGGGFPLSGVGVSCAGRGCRGTSAGPPAFAGAGSVSAAGGGNLVSAPAPAAVGEAPHGVKRLTRAQKLAVALRGCRREPRRRRVACEKRVRRRYGVSNGAGKGR